MRHQQQQMLLMGETSCNAALVTQTHTMRPGARAFNVEFAESLQMPGLKKPRRDRRAVRKIPRASPLKTTPTVTRMIISMWLSVPRRSSLFREIEPWKLCARLPGTYVQDPCFHPIHATPHRTGQTLTMAFSCLCGIALFLAAAMSSTMRRHGDITSCRSTATFFAKCVQR